jgi:NAD-dependent dihydropyrimidine dehydrogenase PreA subunit
MTREGYKNSIIKSAVKTLTAVANRCNIANPIELKSYLATATYTENRKHKMINDEGECAAIRMVEVFETGPKGECVVPNGTLCMDCVACVTQCTEKAVMVIPNDPKEHLNVHELPKWLHY